MNSVTHALVISSIDPNLITFQYSHVVVIGSNWSHCRCNNNLEILVKTCVVGYSIHVILFI